jgi:XTP/dITP diphosphohydrolase
LGTLEELERYAAKTGDDVMLTWDAHKQREKPESASVLDGIPQALPALALADKVLGKAEKLGLIDASDVPAIPMDDEAALGKLLLAIVSSARAAGLEPERALREATRELQVEIRSFELDSDSDAGVIGSY